MQKITRTLTQYHIKAYVVSDGNEPTLTVVNECYAQGTSMTKSEARAALTRAYGETPKKGLTITWNPVSQVTYAMPLDEFIANAEAIETADL